MQVPGLENLLESAKYLPAIDESAQYADSASMQTSNVSSFLTLETWSLLS